MAISSFSAARTICDKSDWRISNLELQKIMYITQMFHMGRNNGTRLFNDAFEAWDYGPVLPGLYHKVKIFGSNPIRDVFFLSPIVRDGTDADFLSEACEHLLKLSPGRLVAITHWKDGAWAKHYRQGEKGIVIPDRDIYQEYLDRDRTHGRQ